MAICNCISNNSSFSIPANPDVAGLGVLVAFAVTAGITFLALVVGWATDSVSENSFNGIDRLLVDRIGRLLNRVNLIRNPSSYNHFARRNLRVKAFERFVLSLSDQQLVTGIAMLFAGYINPCLMDLHHFRMVRALMWFSSLTHLSTLALLRNYMIEHPVVRTWRVIAMVLLGIGLILAVWVSSVENDVTLPAICVWNLRFERERMDHLGAVIFCFLALFLVFAYGNNILGLYTNDPRLSIVEFAIQGLKAKVERADSEDTRRYQPYNAVDPVSPTDYPQECGKQKDLIRFRSRFGDPSSSGMIARARRVLVLGLYVQREISESFLNNILWLIFGNLYGIFQIILTRSSKVHIEGDENQMTFGQVVSLLLLLLPLLTVFEAFFEVHDEVKRSISSGSWSMESPSGISFSPFDSPTQQQTDSEKRLDELTELPNPSDIERGTSTTEKQPSTTIASPGPSATITSLGVASPEQDGGYEKDALLAGEQQKQVIDPYRQSGFKLYMVGIIFLKLGMYILYAFALNDMLGSTVLIIATALVAAPAFLSCAWQFLGLVRVTFIAGLNGVRKISHLE